MKSTTTNSSIITRFNDEAFIIPACTTTIDDIIVRCLTTMAVTFNLTRGECASREKSLEDTTLAPFCKNYSIRPKLILRDYSDPNIKKKKFPGYRLYNWITIKTTYTANNNIYKTLAYTTIIVGALNEDIHTSLISNYHAPEYIDDLQKTMTNIHNHLYKTIQDVLRSIDMEIHEGTYAPLKVK